MSVVKRLAKNVFSLFTGSFISQFIGLLVTVYIARRLGAHQFGVLAFAVAFVGYFKLITDWGITTLAIRNVARERSLTRKYAGSIVVIQLLFSLVAFLVLVIFTGLFHFSPLKNRLIILYGIAFFSTAISLSWVFNAHEKMEYQSLLQVMGRIFYFAGVVLFLHYLSSVIVIPLAYILSSLIVGIVSFWLFSRFFGKISLDKDFNYWKKFIISALPLGGSYIAVYLYYHFDTVMLSFMKGDTVVGWYNASYKIIFVVFSLAGFYSQAIFPVFSKQFKVSVADLKSTFQRSVKLMTIVSIPLAIGGIILARPLISLIFGSDYVNGVRAFQILSCVVIFTYIGRVYYAGLLSCDKQKAYFKIVISCAVINLVLNLILIPPFSLNGAAMATAITEGTSLLLCYYVFGKIVKVAIMKYISKPLIASLIMGVILYLIKGWNLFLSALLGVVIYSVFLFLIKGITIEEINKVKVALFAGR
ncbi:MAG: flippase [bacterium]